MRLSKTLQNLANLKLLKCRIWIKLREMSEGKMLSSIPGKNNNKIKSKMMKKKIIFYLVGVVNSFQIQSFVVREPVLKLWILPNVDLHLCGQEVWFMWSWSTNVSEIKHCWRKFIMYLLLTLRWWVPFANGSLYHIMSLKSHQASP